MGRYSTPLAPRFADFASIGQVPRVFDVGCGPGALTGELVRRFGAESVSAVDPSPGFVEAAGARNPGVDVRRAEAESLPFEGGSFDATLAQLVVHFMSDPAAGIGEMRRVTRRGGVVAACVWDHAGGAGPLARFWSAARELDPEAADESELPGAHEGDLERLLREAGLADVEERLLTVEVEHESFEEWWEPFTLGIGPAGAYVAELAPASRDRLRERCRELHPPPPFVVAASAWAARGVA
jgi:SAM-dependent methyltransferase